MSDLQFSRGDLTAQEVATRSSTPPTARYPAEAAAVAIRTVREHAHDIDLVRFVLLGDDTYDAFAAAASG